MLLEIGSLVLERLLDLHVVLDVELAAIDDADDSQLDDVSDSISCLISLKFVNTLFFTCKKTPHSSASLGTSKIVIEIL